MVKYYSACQENQFRFAFSHTGWAGQKWWFLNGEQVNTTEQNGSILLTLDKSGNYQISVLDLSGQVTAMSFRVK